MAEGVRLNKYLASCGVGSRRACDALVQEGRVEINGQPCLNPATRVAEDDHVRLDGRRVAAREVRTIALNKPRGLVCSRDDELGRETIFSLLPGSLGHLNHVGRLDLESEGLLILTNDGELSQALLHPSKQVEKEYVVTANQPVDPEHVAKFLSGIYTEDGKFTASEVERLSPRRFRVVLTSGHKRQIRVMFRALGYQVQRLVRIRIGGLNLDNLPPGKWRPLEPDEIGSLLSNPKRRPGRRTRRAGDDAGRRGGTRGDTRDTGGGKGGGKSTGKRGRRRPPGRR